MIANIVRASEAIRVATKRVALAPLEQRLERAMRVGFRTQRKAFLTRLATRKEMWPTTVVREALAEDDWDLLFTEAQTATLAVFERPLSQFTQAALRSGLRVTGAQMELATSFDLKHPRAVEYLEGRAAERVAGINETTRKDLRKILVQATDEGWSYQRTAKAITARYEQFAVGVPQKHIRSRAQLIALTEIGESYESANNIVGEELTAQGLEMEKRWQTMRDGRVDGVMCGPNSGAGWVPFGNPYPSGHSHPLAHPGCRCHQSLRRAGSGS